MRPQDSATAAYETPRQRIVVGNAALEAVPAVVAELGCRAVGVVASDRAWSSPLGGALRRALAGVTAPVWTEVPAHTPLATVRRAAAHFAESGVDAVLSLGGGSAGDLAKATAVALANGGDVTSYFVRRGPNGSVDDRRAAVPPPPVLAVPTTLSGAEVTPGAGVTDGGVKHVLWDPAIAARVAFYDTSDANDLPDGVAVGTGMNGVAHCVEALYSSQGGDYSDALAERALRLLGEGLLRYVAGREATSASRRMLFTGAAMAGQALGNARVCLHHAICHVLGARYGVGHGPVNAVMLSHVADLNRPGSAPQQDRCAEILREAAQRALGRPLPAGPLGAVVRAFEDLVGAPTTLPRIGLTEVDVGFVAAALASERGLAFNPLPVGRQDVERLLAAAGAAVVTNGRSTST